MFTLKYPSLSKVIYILNVFLVKSAVGHYCEFDACSEDQYCCGENKCCKKTVEVWYFWAAILLIVIAVFVVICLYVGWKKRHKYGAYNLLNEEKELVS